MSARRLANPPAYTRSSALKDLVRISFSSLPLRPKAAEINPDVARWFAPTITFSRTVKSPNNPTPCKVREIPKSTKLEVCGKSCSLPSKKNFPESGFTNPHNALNKVVLPAPFGPINPTTSFLPISK